MREASDMAAGFSGASLISLAVVGSDGEGCPVTRSTSSACRRTMLPPGRGWRGEPSGGSLVVVGRERIEKEGESGILGAWVVECGR